MPTPGDRLRPVLLRFGRDSSAFEATFASMVGQEPVDRTLVTWPGHLDSVYFQLGSGQDRGEIVLRGRRDGDSITGRWSQVLYVGGATGTFAVRRE